MSITPPSGSPPSSSGLAPRRPQASSPKALGTKAAQNDEQERLAETQRRVQDMQNELEANMGRLRDTYERQSSTEIARREEALEDQRAQGYESLREMQREQRKDMTEAKKEGEKQLAEIHEHYRNAVVEADRHGRKELKEVRDKHAMMTNYEQKAGEQAMHDLRAGQAHQMERFRRDREGKAEEITEAYRKEHDRLKVNLEQAHASREQQFAERHRATLEDQHQRLATLQEQAAAKLNEVRQGTARKLEAYVSRQKDPFYQMIETDAELRDLGDVYVLMATVPEHEQDSISVSVNGKELLLKGSRRNNEKLELEHGRSRATASFQSFSESFKLDVPVEARQLTKEFDGDQLIVTIPKSGKLAPQGPYQGKKHVERARADRPDFPENLPGIRPENPKGSRTLG